MQFLEPVSVAQLVEHSTFNRRVVGSNPARRTLPIGKKFIKKGREKIKQIDKRALDVLIKEGYVKPGPLKGIAITSKYKHSRAKHYYAKDIFAFTAWEILGDNPSDKEFQKWKQRKER